MRRTSPGLPIVARLSYYSIPEPNSGCHLWLGSMRKDGYGKLFIERRWHLVHRVAWTDKNGPIPDSLYVCHKCDVRACVNPDHLFLGTAADNAADRDRKGRNRQPSGSRNAKAKLTEAQVYAIKRDGRSEQEIADIYQVHQTTINVILRGKTWRHVQ